MTASWQYLFSFAHNLERKTYISVIWISKTKQNDYLASCLKKKTTTLFTTYHTCHCTTTGKRRARVPEYILTMPKKNFQIFNEWVLKMWLQSICWIWSCWRKDSVFDKTANDRYLINNKYIRIKINVWCDYLCFIPLPMLYMYIKLKQNILVYLYI